MKYDEFIVLYDNNMFREIDKYDNCKKFYLLRSISKAKTLKLFCGEYELEPDLNSILENEDIDENTIISFIKSKFHHKSSEDIKKIESELNKMQNFDWGGSKGNSLEKNIVNNYVKKILNYNDIADAISGSIQQSVYGYTMNSWYNHWSTILIEEIFNNNERVLPTVDLVKNIDFFIDSVPFDLKVTYFPKELMKMEIEDNLNEKYGSKSELTCMKKIAEKCEITVPKEMRDEALTICLYNLLKESVQEEAENFIEYITKIKKDVIEYYMEHPEKLMKWLYENQGEMRFDAANRIYLVLVDTDNIFDSWKLKRNVNLLKMKIEEKMKEFDTSKVRKLSFVWKNDGKTYDCLAETLFVVK